MPNVKLEIDKFQLKLKESIRSLEFNANRFSVYEVDKYLDKEQEGLDGN